VFPAPEFRAIELSRDSDQNVRLIVPVSPIPSGMIDVNVPWAV
jgi:hypothetical protein